MLVLDSGKPCFIHLWVTCASMASVHTIVTQTMLSVDTQTGLKDLWQHSYLLMTLLRENIAETLGADHTGNKSLFKPWYVPV